MNEIYIEKWLTFTIDGKWDKERVCPVSFVSTRIGVTAADQPSARGNARRGFAGPWRNISAPNQARVNLPTRSLDGYATIPDWACINCMRLDVSAQG